MQYYMTISEIQERLTNVILQLVSSPQTTTLPAPFVHQLQLMVSQVAQVDVESVDNIESTLIDSFLNAMILAGQMGIDLEQKINEFLTKLELNALCAC